MLLKFDVRVIECFVMANLNCFVFGGFIWCSWIVACDHASIRRL